MENGENLNRTDTDGVVTRFFRSCMDTAEMERLQYKPLFSALRDLNVSLPMLESLADHDTPGIDLTAYATYVMTLKTIAFLYDCMFRQKSRLFS